MLAAIKNPKIRSSIRFLTVATLFVAFSLVWFGYSTTNGKKAGKFKKPEVTRTGGQTSDRMSTRIQHLPLYFERNVGQAPEEVHYLTRGSGYGVLFNDTSATILFSNQAKEKKVSLKNETGKTSLLKLHWENARPSFPVGESLQKTRFHYFSGNQQDQWHTDIETYLAVRYPGVYPGIDLVFYGNRQQPEYDFIVAPGANFQNIRLNFEGAQSLNIGSNGRLNIRTSNGTLSQDAPRIYQVIDGKKISREGGYTLDSQNRVGFHIAHYDPDHPLIIDPVLLLRTYSTYLGGSGAEVGFDIALDSSGNAYIAGRTTSSDFPTQGAFQGSLSGGSGSDAFVAKLSADGTSLVYGTYLGGIGFDEALSVAVNSSGQAHITGRTTSTGFPTQNPLQGSLSGGAGEDAFVTKLSADGASLVFSTYLGGGNTDQGHGITVDSSGNVYVTGQTNSTNFPTSLAFQGALAGGAGNDVFLTKIAPSGLSFIFSTYLGGTGEDLGRGVALDSDQNAYLTGSTKSTNFPTQSPFQGNIGDGTGTANDAFFTKFNSNGASLAFSSYFGGTGEDVGNDIAVDNADRLVITGRTASTNFPTAIPFQGALSGGSGTDAFVSRILVDGNGLQFSTYLGGDAFDEGMSVTVDSAFSVLVAGRTDSTDFPVRNALQGDLNGGSGSDGFATRFNSFGNLQSWSTYIGGTGTEQATGIAVDSALDAYVVGFTGSTDFQTETPFQGTLGGGGLDAFLTKLRLIDVNPELASSSSVMSPYYQVSDDVYSFIAITHPSLAGMNSRIGVRAVAFNNDGFQFGTTQEFTVDAGQTAKIFFAQPTNANINPGNIPGANFIIGTLGSGRVRFGPIASEPTEVIPGPGGGLPDVTMLSYWGAVVIEGFLSGFAVSFVGDINDTGSHPDMAPGHMPTGVN
ncbi:MAG: hypothetical protein G3M70_01255 [Candidatus Nitronauta litoralis]|uniref:DUF7948 domain-containing protein n=1 Tax=Candidatus Nitronauta litoralis TaxID=2705533 RepID=A0A7T0FYZ1_9BACT|nr:MAG: hypothetical protein G3M70_01255 [Candidatus Nitronauta litoralis]